MRTVSRNTHKSGKPGRRKRVQHDGMYTTTAHVALRLRRRRAGVWTGRRHSGSAESVSRLSDINISSAGGGGGQARVSMLTLVVRPLYTTGSLDDWKFEAHVNRAEQQRS